MPQPQTLWRLRGITATMVDLHEKGLIRKPRLTCRADRNVCATARNPNHIEISANHAYANPASQLRFRRPSGRGGTERAGATPTTAR